MLRKIGVVLILLLIFFVSSRALITGKLFFTHDFVHGARISEMTTALSQGHFPAEWSQNFGYGYGMPLFQFYGPLPYYFGSLVYIVFNSLPWAVLSLFLFANSISLLGAYRLGTEIGGRWAGVLVSALFVLAPYRAVQLFVRGSISESWALSFFPWLLLGWWGMVVGKPKAWLLVTVSTAMIVLSHNLSALLLIPMGVIFGCTFVLWRSGKPLKQTKRVLRDCGTVLKQGLSATVLSFGLVSFYVIPSFLEKHFTKLDSFVLAGYFDFRNHFLYLRQFLRENWGYGGSAWGPADGMSFFIGFGMLLALVISGYFVMQRVSQNTQKLQLSNIISGKNFAIGIVFVVIGASVLLTTEKTRLIWESIGIFRYLQFPWRLMSPLSLLLPLLILFLFSAYWKTKKLAIVAVIATTIITSWKYFQPSSYLEDAQALYYSDPERIAREMSGILPDYIPLQLSGELEPTISLLNQDVPSDANILFNGVAEKLLETSAKEDRVQELLLSYFPGWTVYIDGAKINSWANDAGLLTFTLPSGSHLLSVKYENTPIRFTGKLISIASLGLLLVVIARQSKKQS